MYYANSQGSFWVFDKGNSINGKLSSLGMCMFNCGTEQQYYRYIGENGKTYGIKAGLTYSNGLASSYIQLPREELISISEW